MLRKRRCWYCRRVSRFGFSKPRYPGAAPECRYDEPCFKRASIVRG